MRDLIGYSQEKPNFECPNGARIAINFVINFEAGAEQCPADGDPASESLLVDLPGCMPRPEGERHLSAESLFEYGSRCGIWRLHRLFDQHDISVTVFACGRALERHQPYANYLRDSPHEVAGHGYQWIDYRSVPAAIERQHIERSLAIIPEMTGKTVTGWYTGRRSGNTLALLAQHDLLYLSDSYADDVPYWMSIDAKAQLIFPYNLVTNDCRYATLPGFSNWRDFYDEIKAAFDFHYQTDEPLQLLTIALHDRLSGRPSRAYAVQKFLEYIQRQAEVWIATRADIARYWRQQTRLEECR